MKYIIFLNLTFIPIVTVFLVINFLTFDRVGLVVGTVALMANVIVVTIAVARGIE